MKRKILLSVCCLLIILFSSCEKNTGSNDYNEVHGFPEIISIEYCTIQPYYISRNYLKEEVMFYDPDRTIVYIPCGTTADEFMQKMEKPTTLTDSQGNAVSGDTKLGTGFLIDSVSYGDYTVVILGDINGDGEITAEDSGSVNNYLNGTVKASELAYALAADVDVSFSITNDDYTAIEAEIDSENPGVQWYNKLDAFMDEEHTFTFEFCSEYIN